MSTPEFVYKIATAAAFAPARGAASFAGMPIDAAQRDVTLVSAYQPAPSAIAAGPAESIIAIPWGQGYVIADSGERIDGSPGQTGVAIGWPWVTWDGDRYVSAPTPIVTIAQRRVALASEEHVKMLPAAHEGGLSRVFLRITSTSASRARAVRTR